MATALPGDAVTAARPIRRVFISSTSVDLHAHRERVRDVLLSLGLFPVGMEQFGAQGTGDASSVSADKVAGCDVYLGIIAWRYGHVPAGSDRSVTQQEYEEATRLRLPRYVFVADPATDAPEGPESLFPAAVRDPEHRLQLEGFRAEVTQARVVDFFTTPADLAARVATALHTYVLQLQRAEMTTGLRPPHDLPPRAPEFVGRERELVTLCDALRSGQSTGMSLALAGMAGVGKSALAAETLHALAADPDMFPGGVTWVRCDGRTGVAGLAWLEDQLMGAWGVTVSPEEIARAVTAEAEVELRERALRARLQPAGNPHPPAALVLLDNVERDLPVGRALDALAPLGITVLLTARHEPSSPRLRLLPLDVLDPEPAIQLFAERYESRGGVWDNARDHAPASEVVEALGWLPLAIELAAVRAARAHTGVAALADELREADRLGRLRDPLDPTRSVRYAFERSLAALNPLQRVRFAALGLPDGPDWPHSVIERLLAAVPHGAENAAPASDDLDLLAALSLVALMAPDAAEAPSPRVRLHPLLRELAREEWARQPAPTRMSCLTALLDSVGALAQESRRDFATLARYEDLIAGTLRRAAREGIEPSQLVATIGALEQYLDLGGHWRLGMELSTLQLAACRAVKNRTGEAQTLNNLGYLAHRLGGAEDAGRYYDQALARWRELGDQAGQGETLNNLGSLARGQGRLEQAGDYYRQALALRRQVGDRAGEGTTLNNLGTVATDLGRLDDAARYYEQALALRRELGDRAGEGVILNNLGGLADKQGRRDEAARCYAQALELVREAGDRASEGATLDNLGSLARAQGREEEAAGYYEQSLALRRELGDRVGEGTTLHNLGVLFGNLKRPEEAKRYFEQALTVERELGDRSGEAATLTNLGLLAQAQRRPQDAARYYNEALPIQRAGADQTGEGLTLNSLGMLAYAQARPKEAKRYFEHALTILEGVGAADSARVVRQNLAALEADYELGASADPANAAGAPQPSASIPAPVAPGAHATDVPDNTALPLPAMPPPAGPTRRWWPWGR
jgi:tetratricopeptide (TPR) repeat protein